MLPGLSSSEASEIVGPADSDRGHGNALRLCFDQSSLEEFIGPLYSCPDLEEKLANIAHRPRVWSCPSMPPPALLEE